MMKKTLILFAILLCATPLLTAQKTKKGWISLWNGQNFDGWKANEDNPATFSIENGSIKIDGPRAHLFYDGPVANHSFKNFELKVTAMTRPGANSGIFIHSQYQAKGWPEHGYEVQVNNSQSDWRRTGSLYAVADVKDTLVADNVWYQYHIIVKDKNIRIKINGKEAVNYTEPAELPADRSKKRLSAGTFALQGHDPKSVAFFKDIKVKILKD
jgi:hypothetical protein